MSKKYEIYPIPQVITYGEKSLKITSGVKVVAGEGVKATTLRLLQTALQGAGYTVAEDTQDDVTTITLNGNGTINGENKVEGYTLAISGDACAQVIINGCDADGIHYGAVTLIKIIKQVENGVVEALDVQDYPEIMYRGYIEGFYGFPWSHEDRKDLMVFTGQEKMNAYIYAPKDDPYHRSHWRDLYPEQEAKQITELAEAGAENNVHFVWTIHPGDSIDLDSEADFQSTINKLEQLYALGVRQFGILFDDIGGWPNGEQQANYINRVDTEFIKAKGDVRPLLTVGTRYCEAWGPSMKEYFKPFVDILHDDVEIMWTGSATMSNVSREQFDAPMRLIESDKNLSVWWNYPVNDYCDAKLLMGKIENLKPDVDNINGFFSNPMNQAQASKQALFCIADHNWNTDVFDCEKSFEASFRALVPEVAKELQIFASNCSYVKEDGGVSGTFLFDESWYLRDAITAVESGLEQGADLTQAVESLVHDFTEMEQAVDTIDAKCENAQLMAELRPFLDATRLMAQAGQNLMAGIKSLQAGDIAAMELVHENALRQVEGMEECKVLRLKDGAERYFTVDVGTLTVKPFIKEMLKRCAVIAGVESKPMALNYDMDNIALMDKGVTATCSGTVQQGQEPEKVIDGTIKSGKWCSRDFRPHLTIDLQEVKNIKQYRMINCGHPEAGETRIWNTKGYEILTSCDGENFQVVDTVLDNKEDLINRMLFDQVDARYVRLQITEPAQISINGGGHTRIYAFEIFDQAYPEQSNKVLPSDIDAVDNKVVIRQVNKGEVIKLYTTIDGQEAQCVSSEVTEGQTEVVFEGLDLAAFNGRVCVERTAKNYLPSVRTSKAI